MADDDKSVTGSLMGAALGVGLISGAPSVLHGLGVGFKEGAHVSAGSVVAGAAAGAVLGYIAGHMVSGRRNRQEAGTDSPPAETAKGQDQKQWAASVTEASQNKTATPGISA